MSEAAASPENWLNAQLSRPEFPPALMRRPTSAERVQRFAQIRGRPGKGEVPESVRKALRIEGQNILKQEIKWRIMAAGETSTPFAERLVNFWCNHFTVSVTNPFVGPLAGPFEREAIRPHITAKFESLLQSAVLHPAMLIYLDNAGSIGPGSQAGKRRGKGLNENLAREILELHTLGVDGGYKQDDVIALAKILTGWTVNRNAERGENTVRFIERQHEPGTKTLLGRRYPESGPEEIKHALTDLARHPATAKFIARKLAVHFISDNPPQSAIDKFSRVFELYAGDLHKVSQSIIDTEEAWSLWGAKIKTPYELLVSCIRVCGHLPHEDRWQQAFTALGQPVFNAPSPAGWPDTGAHWLSPDAIVNRLELCRALALNLPKKVDPRAVSREALGELLSANTKREIERAPSAAVGLALLFASPEFQRR